MKRAHRPDVRPGEIVECKAGRRVRYLGEGRAGVVCLTRPVQTTRRRSDQLSAGDFDFFSTDPIQRRLPPDEFDYRFTMEWHTWHRWLAGAEIVDE